MNIEHTIELPNHLIEAHRIEWMEKHKATGTMSIHFDSGSVLELDQRGTQHFIPQYNDYQELRQTIIKFQIEDAGLQLSLIDSEDEQYDSDGMEASRKRALDAYDVIINEIQEVLDEEKKEAAGYTSIESTQNQRDKDRTIRQFNFSSI